MHKYRLSYFIGQGFKGLWTNRMMTLASIFILMFCLNILGAFSLLIYNIDVNVDKIGDLNVISAFVEAKASYEEGTAVTLAGAVQAKDPQGPKFLGWSTDQTATVAEYTAGGVYTVKGADSISGVITLYAVWDGYEATDDVSVLYSASGTAIDSDLPVDQNRYQIGDTLTLPEGPEPHYMDISFLGWSTDPSAEKGALAGETITLTEENVKNGKVILYAIWSEKATHSAYEIVYNENGHAIMGELPTDEQIRLADIQNKIEALSNISKIELVTKEDALKEELDNYKDHPELVEELLAGENFYPNMFSIYYEDNAFVDNLEYQLSSIEGVYKVDCRSDYAQNIESIKNGVILVFVWFLAIIFLFSILIIVNTVKLIVHSRQDEISVMSYIGAAPWFIALPYIFEGILIGLISGVLAFFTEKFLYSRVQQMLTTDFEMITVVPFNLFSTSLLVAFLVIGVITGVIGSSISLKRYMKN